MSKYLTNNMHIRPPCITVTAADLTFYKLMWMNTSITAVLYLLHTLFTPVQDNNFFVPCSTWQMRFHLIVTHKGEYVLHKYFPEKCKLWRGIKLKCKVIIHSGQYCNTRCAVDFCQSLKICSCDVSGVSIHCLLCWTMVRYSTKCVSFWELRQKDNILRQMCLCISVA